MTAQLDITIENFGTGFNSPVGIKNAGDDRLFIVEKQGQIKILNSNGTTNATPFLNIESLVIDVSNSDERGLLGLAFHPDYSVNGYFFVNYIDLSGNTVISRFTVSPNSEVADNSSEQLILSFTQPFVNHNGGDMHFGNDGYLYISSGDGGSFGDPQNNSQNLETFLGTILRIDIDNSSGGNNYDIPNDNPFLSNPNALNEIWAYGLRNPWRFSFDNLTGNMWIADVGSQNIEEIDMMNSSNAGANFGWRCYEGSIINDLQNCPDENTLTFPIAEYSHFASGNFKCSITGGYVHRGSINTSFNGYYFFADYCSNEIGTINVDGSNYDIYYSQPFDGNNWTTFGQDINGELYIAGGVSGMIYKIVPVTLKTDKHHLKKEIKIYPNPTTDLVNIALKNSLSISDISIFNLQGKLIEAYSDLNDNTIRISTKQYQKGIYLIKISTTEKNNIYKKLVVH